MKTIRLNLSDLEEDMSRGSNSVIGADYKVLVLFRDPRAILNSLKLTPDFWSSEVQSEHHVCLKINRILDTISQMNSSRIMTLKYEDFIEKPYKLVQDIFKFMTVPYLAPFAMKELKKHKVDDVQETKWDKVLAGEIVKPKTRKIKLSKGKKQKYFDSNFVCSVRVLKSNMMIDRGMKPLRTLKVEGIAYLSCR